MTCESENSSEEYEVKIYYHSFVNIPKYFLVLSFPLVLCFDLAGINARCPPKLLYHSPSSAGQGRENVMKGSRVETRTGREHSPITVTDKTG